MTRNNQCKCKEVHGHQAGECVKPTAEGKELCPDCEAHVLTIMTAPNESIMTQLPTQPSLPEAVNSTARMDSGSALTGG
jgi:hypothetical protein